MSKKKPTKLPAARDLVPVGPREVQISHRGKRDQNGLKPTTSRALVLRNGKYGARGTGEVMLVGKITGREKLDLLAEDLVSQKLRTAVRAPLKLDKCIKIADSQYNAYLDDVADLKDPDSFHHKIVVELAARALLGSVDSKNHVRSASHVTSVVSTKIHNAYMVASGWRLVIDLLRDLKKSGLDDATARTQLQSDDNLRSRYLALCDIVGILVDLGQAHFSLVAMTTPHYSRYFKEVENAQHGEPSIGFDWDGLKDVCRSFMDSIIIELCFPRAPYPRRILYHILHDAVDESPKEAKRFPQAMWDAVGDLSVSLELQELLDGPLLGLQGEKLRLLPRQMPEKYERWLDAQIYSKKALESCANFEDIINPLKKTKDPTVLDDMWRLINLTYQVVSGLSVDSVWQLDEALRRTPQWSSFYMSSLRTYETDSDAEQSSMPVLRAIGHKKAGGKRKQKKFLEITDGRVDDHSDSSIPELRSVSDSSGDEDEDGVASESDEGEESDEDGYGSEEDEVHRTMLREAMDTAMAIPEFFDPKTTVPEFDALAEERKENPFLKLLGSLRGRLFSSDPKLSSTTRTEPRKGFFGKKDQATKASAKQATAPPTLAKASGTSGGKTPSKGRPSSSAVEERKDYRATVEDAEDDEDVQTTTGKKKKKKPKKKKKEKKSTTSELPIVHEDSVPVVSTLPKNPPAATLTETPVQPPPSKLPATNVLPNPLARVSTSSLPIQPTVAQSGRSYLQDLNAPKEKVKSRPDHASLFSEKRGFLSKLGSKDKAEREKEDKDETAKKASWFSRLGKKSLKHMGQILHINADEKAGSLKWENFLKVMRDMGFKYDPSTAGSSVRFDPPDPRDRSITLHKPHPDTTIYPYKLREFRNKLKTTYGWSEEDFMRRVSSVDGNASQFQVVPSTN